MKVVIIKYNSGNVRSVSFALERLGIQPVITDNAETIRAADRVIFPGVGEASSAMRFLRNMQLDEVIISLTQPVLGICLGMQLLCKYSDEGATDCLGIFDEQVKKFPQREGFKIPQIGWNTVYDLRSPLFAGLQAEEYMYFVHSYYVKKCTNTIAVTDYTGEYSSALQKNNFFAAQFHPEKSGAAGETVLRNFLGIK